MVYYWSLYCKRNKYVREGISCFCPGCLRFFTANSRIQRVIHPEKELNMEHLLEKEPP